MTSVADAIAVIITFREDFAGTAFSISVDHHLRNKVHSSTGSAIKKIITIIIIASDFFRSIFEIINVLSSLVDKFNLE